MGWRLPWGDPPSEPTAGTTSGCTWGRGLLSCWMADGRKGESRWAVFGGHCPLGLPLASVPTGVFADHFLVPSQPQMVAGNQWTSPSWLKTRTFAPAGEGKCRVLGTRKAVANTSPRAWIPSLTPHPLPWRSWGAVLTLMGPANHVQIEVTPGEIRDA